MILHAVGHSQLTVTRQNQQDPTIRVQEGEITLVSYSLTYPMNSSYNYTLFLRNGGRNILDYVHGNPCHQPGTHLSLEVTEVSKRCHEGGMVTDWYALFVNGTEEVQGVNINCTISISVIGGSNQHEEPCSDGVNATIQVIDGGWMHRQA